MADSKHRGVQADRWRKGREGTLTIPTGNRHAREAEREDLILLIIIGSVALPLIGAVGWAIFVIFIAKAALQGARQLDQTLPDIERSLRQLKRLPAGRQTAEQAHIAAAIAQAQKQLRDLDQLSRQRYDARMGEIASAAANAGISWTPPSY